MDAVNVRKTSLSPGAFPGERPLSGKGAVLCIAVIVVWSCCICAASLLYTAEASADGHAAVRLYASSAEILLLNLLPILLLQLALFFLTKKVWLSALITGVLFGSLTLANYYKLLLRGDPLMFIDITFITEAADMAAGAYKNEFIVTKTMIAGVAVFILALALTIIFVRRGLTLSARLRVPIAIVLIALLAVLTPTLYESSGIYASTSGIETGKSGFNVYSDADQYVSRGVVYSFLHSISNASAKKPDGYKKSEAAEMLSEYGNSDIPEDKKVSVMAVMLEAYNDFSKFGLEFTQDPYTQFHELQNESISGTLVTNIFAGGTTDTERGFLTGFSEFYEFRKKTPSLASYFASQGYDTFSAHPGYGWFYNRQNVNKYFGFEENCFFENRYEKTGYMYNDSGFFGDLCDMFEEKTETGNPTFCFAVTYHNHGPYDEWTLEDDTFVVRGGLSDGAYTILNNYLNGISNTDRAIGELKERLSLSDEPVVLVLFGDHNPWMGDASFVFEELGVNLDRDTDEGFYNYYETPFVIWANDAAKEIIGSDFNGDGGSFSPMLLGEKLFSCCSWDGSAIIKAQRDMLASGVDVVHELGFYRVDGVITKELTETESAAVQNYQSLQYYLRTEG